MFALNTNRFCLDINLDEINEAQATLMLTNRDSERRDLSQKQSLRKLIQIKVEGLSENAD